MRDVLVGDAPPEALRHWWYIAMVGLAGVVIVGFSIRVIAERMGLRTRPMRPIDEYRQIGRGHAVWRACPAYRAAYALSAMSERPDEQQRGPAQTFVCRQPCPMCQSLEPPIDVHGHSQCATCKINIDPCCGGAAFELPAAS